ncbi:LOW QUALITY PROTEIN: M-phase phosphoprotein 9 [Menidia menidia]
MSTDDSVSEDVSSSGALSHCHVSADGDAGKESEASLVSSEGTSASGRLAVLEERRPDSQTTGGPVETRALDITPACNKIRSLCLSTDEAFEHEKHLPFINPSSLETLRALVHEIQSSGETDPEMWKDCESRWLHLFQLVEKQYQEQILAQQEQYQCQIQLIQDEIKALVQLQNRQACVQPHADFSPAPLATSTANTKDFIFPISLKTAPADGEAPAAPGRSPVSSPSSPPPPPRAELHIQGEERATTVLSSGYGTLGAWETGLETAEGPGEDGEEDQGRPQSLWGTPPHQDTAGIGPQQDVSKEKDCPHQKGSGTSQQLTSWAQRQKLRPKKSKAGPVPAQTPEAQGRPGGLRESGRRTPPDSTNSPDEHRPAGPPSSSFSLRRSDSLMSEASGLTYWRLNECELYRPLPDSLDSGAYLFLQEASTGLTPPPEPRISLREIYQNKQKDCTHPDWEGSLTSSPLSPQVFALDPAATARQSDRTSGFTSPSHFSSPSFAAQPRVGTPGTPDSMAGSPNPGDTDCISDSSSASASREPANSREPASRDPTSREPASRGLASRDPTSREPASRGLASRDPTSRDPTPRGMARSPLGGVARPPQQRRPSAPLASEEEGSRTHTSTLKPGSASIGPHPEGASSLEDPVVLSLLRQNLREKHSRHVADLKAYYESEIQVLRDKLKLRDLPQDLEKSNQALTERCKHLEKALADATGRVQELEAANSSLEKKLAEWPERYAVAGAAVKSLQQRLEEGKRSGREREAQAARLKARVRQLEEEEQKQRREAEEREASREQEHKMLQDLLGEYDSVMNEHEAVKNKLLSAESKLVDAGDHISELKRVISKLESQVKQLEHENQARLRFASHSNTQPSGAGLFHHPDLLLSPSKSKPEPDVTRRKSPCNLSEQLSGGRRSQPGARRRPPPPAGDHSSGTGSSVDASSAGGGWRCASPPECEQSGGQREAGWRDGSSPLTPVMRALIELEETKATEGRAPWGGHQRTTVGFVERRLKEPIGEQLQAGGGAAERGGPRRAGALLRAQRSLSPEGHRSSSLPPPAHRNLPPATPTKRETLLTPMSAKSSPKRCPTENYSTAFGHLMPREEHLLQRQDGAADKRRHSIHSSSPRKRLQFPSAENDDLLEQASLGGVMALGGGGAAGGAVDRTCWTPARTRVR